MRKILQIISSQRDQGRLAHAYLVIGEVSIAEIAGQLKIKNADQLVIDENPAKIFHIRELIHWLNLRPHSSLRKLAFIRKIDNITTEAANALLKILEEPPHSSILILQAEKKDKVLPTILSRCQIIKSFSNKKTTVADYLDPAAIARKNLKERFDYATQIAESPNLNVILNLWEQDYRQRLLTGKDVRLTLKRIFKVKDLLSTNTSVKLLLENLLMQMEQDR